MSQRATLPPPLWVVALIVAALVLGLVIGVVRAVWLAVVGRAARVVDALAANANDLAHGVTRLLFWQVR